MKRGTRFVNDLGHGGFQMPSISFFQNSGGPLVCKSTDGLFCFTSALKSHIFEKNYHLPPEKVSLEPTGKIIENFSDFAIS